MSLFNRTALTWKVCKQTLRILAQHAPLFRTRVSFLRMAPYKIGRHVYFGQDLIIIDELEHKAKNQKIILSITHDNGF